MFKVLGGGELFGIHYEPIVLMCLLMKDKPHHHCFRTWMNIMRPWISYFNHDRFCTMFFINLSKWCFLLKQMINIGGYGEFVCGYAQYMRLTLYWIQSDYILHKPCAHSFINLNGWEWLSELAHFSDQHQMIKYKTWAQKGRMERAPNDRRIQEKRIERTPNDQI